MLARRLQLHLGLLDRTCSKTTASPCFAHSACSELTTTWPCSLCLLRNHNSPRHCLLCLLRNHNSTRHCSLCLLQIHNSIQYLLFSHSEQWTLPSSHGCFPVPRYLSHCHLSRSSTLSRLTNTNHLCLPLGFVLRHPNLPYHNYTNSPARRNTKHRSIVQPTFYPQATLRRITSGSRRCRHQH